LKTHNVRAPGLPTLGDRLLVRCAPWFKSLLACPTSCFEMGQLVPLYSLAWYSGLGPASRFLTWGALFFAALLLVVAMAGGCQHFPLVLFMVGVRHPGVTPLAS
jgi:hypothetical protein